MGMTSSMDDLPATHVSALLAVDARWKTLEAERRDLNKAMRRG